MYEHNGGLLPILEPAGDLFQAIFPFMCHSHALPPNFQRPGRSRRDGEAFQLRSRVIARSGPEVRGHAAFPQTVCIVKFLVGELMKAQKAVAVRNCRCGCSKGYVIAAERFEGNRVTLLLDYVFFFFCHI